MSDSLGKCEYDWPDVMPNFRKVCHSEAVGTFDGKLICGSHKRQFNRCFNEYWHDARNLNSEPCGECGMEP